MYKSVIAEPWQIFNKIFLDKNFIFLKLLHNFRPVEMAYIFKIKFSLSEMLKENSFPEEYLYYLSENYL